MKPKFRSIAAFLSSVLAITWAGSFSASAATQTWNVAGPSNNWSTSPADTNWLTGAAWTDGNSATFSGATGETVTVVGTVTPVAIDIGTGNGSWVLDTPTGTSVIAGSGTTLTKNGSGSLTINGTVANTFTGLTTLAGTGDLTLQKTAGVTAIAGDIAILGTGVLKLTNANQIADTSNITIAGTGNNGGIASAMTETVASVTSTGNAGKFNLGSGTNFTITGRLSITGSNGSTNTNFYSLAANGAASTLNVGSISLDNAFYGIGQSGGANAATVNLSGGLTGANTSSLNSPGGAGAQRLVLTGAGTHDHTFSITSGTTAISTAISQTASTTATLTKTGTGTLTLSGASLYTGTTTVAMGPLTVSGSLNGATGTPLTFTGTGSFGVSDAAAGTARTMGALLTSAGDGTVQATYGTSGSSSLTFGSLSARTIGSTANFVVTGGANGTTNKIVLGGVTTDAFINPGTFFGGSSYAWNDTTGYVRGIVYGTDAGSFTAAGGASLSSASGTHAQTTAAVTAQATDSFTDLNISGASNLTLASGATLSLTGLLKTGGNATTIATGTLTAVSGQELVIRTDLSTDSVTVNSTLNVGTAGMTKSGAGKLTIGTITGSGRNTVNAGTVALTASSGNTTNTGDWYINGGTIDVGNGGSGGAGNLFNGANTTNKVNFGAGGGTLAYHRITATNIVVTLSGVTGTVSMIGTMALTQSGVGTIGGGLAFLQNGSSSGNTTLSLANTYTGGTTVASNTLFVTNPAALGTGPVTVTGGTLDVGSTALGGIGALTLTGGTVAGATGSITAPSYDVRAGTISATLAGSGSLTKTTTGTVTLSGTNTYSGKTTVSAGTLQPVNAAALSGFNTAGQLSVASGATLALSVGGSGQWASSDITSLLTANGAGFIAGSTLAINTAGGNFVHSDVISGGETLSKTGANTLTLSGANTHTGGTTVQSGAGALIITTPAALGTGTVSIPKGGTATGTLVLATTGSNTISNAFAGFNSTTSFGGGGTADIQNTSGNNKITGTLTVTGTGGNGVTLQSDAGLLEIAGNVTTTITNRMVDVGGAGNGLISGNVLDGTSAPFTFTKDGTGTWTLTGTNTYSAGTNINAGTLQIGNGGATGTPGTGNVTNNGTLAFNRDATTDLTVSAVISGTGAVAQNGTGKTILTGVNTYTGDTLVNAGILSLPTAFLADTSKVKIAATGAALDLNYGGSDVVDQLHIGGVQQAAGKWGAIGSVAGLGADFETSAITGTGLLVVMTGPSASAYTTWATLYGLSAGVNDGHGANPDNDTLNNIGEFGLDGNPLSGVTDGKVVSKIVTLGGQPVLTLTLPVRNGAVFTAPTSDELVSAVVDGVIYHIQGSADLATFGAVISEITNPTDLATVQGTQAVDHPLDSGWTYRSFRSSTTVATAPKAFLRAKVTE